MKHHGRRRGFISETLLRCTNSDRFCKKIMAKELVDTHQRALKRLGFNTLPSAIRSIGPGGIRRLLEFVTVAIRNKNARLAYAQAIGQFFVWCDRHHVQSIDRIEPMLVASYVEQHR